MGGVLSRTNIPVTYLAKISRCMVKVRKASEFYIRNAADKIEGAPISNLLC